jgi:hypothetical protein
VHSDLSPLRRLGRPLTVAIACAALALPAFALADSGGTGGPGSGGGSSSGPANKARLQDGRATIPSNAPPRIKKVIEAANRIAKGKGYCMGGGHGGGNGGSWRDNCYDCSGAVSYALHGGRFIDSAVPSGSLAKWGRKGRGNWMTVYAHSGHAYMVVAGLRFDTSMTRGEGPGWSRQMRSSSGFKVRHRRGF